jgi:DNA adenine methylase
MSDRPEASPLLKWIGGKRWLAPRLAQYYSPKRRLVDPFVGGMSIPLGLRAEKAVISDINPHLINLYRWLQIGLVPDASVNLVNTEKVYYENRTRFNVLCHHQNYWTKEGALLFYYLNRTCFNGLCRFNQSGMFNAAYGKYKKLIYREDFSIYKEVMAGWVILHGDFQKIQLEADDFIYADPPYDDVFTKFTPEDFGWDDQERLAKWLAAHPGPVIASNSYTDRIVDLYKGLGFQVYVGAAPRRVSCDGNREDAKEILALRNI